MGAVARGGDIRMLNERLKHAKTEQERELIRSKLAFIAREAQDPVVGKLREQLVNAARNGDNEAGDKISEQIYLHQQRKGLI